MKSQQAISSKEIQNLICKMEVLRHNIPCENVKYLFSDWEIDVLAINKSSNITEYEVKVSRSDFKADSKKKKWRFYERMDEKLISNYFYYVCPDGLIKESEVPQFAGLMYLVKGELKTIKSAPLLHRLKHDRIKVLNKFCQIATERLYLGNCRMTYERKKIIADELTRKSTHH